MSETGLFPDRLFMAKNMHVNKDPLDVSYILDDLEIRENFHQDAIFP